MTLKNTPERYGGVAKGFHWLVALLVIGLLCAGLYMVRQDPSPSLFKLYFFHKSFGITVLALVVLRLIWRLVNVRPVSLPNHRQWEKILAKAVHVMLYAALFIMPLSGWVMSSAKGFSVSVFGWFTLPDLVAENKALAETAVRVHETTAYALIVLLALHVAGALKHHLIDKDTTLRRMLPFVRMVFAAGVLVLMPAAAQAQTGVPSWIIDPEQSGITFEGTQMGASFTGTFGDFNGVILFDPDRLDQSSAVIKIRTASANTKSSERDQHIATESWFNAESFPESEFRTKKIEKIDENQYIAHGELTLRGVTLPVDLPFTLTIVQDAAGQHAARMEGSTTLKRLDFGIGQGDWRDTSMVGNDVIVRVSISAHRAQ